MPLREVTIAEAVKTALTEKCGVAEQNCIVLLNERATLANITKVLRDALPKLTRAGDVVFIYWSGHGGRCADSGGDEEDGYDEYLPAHDSKRFEMDTMLMDDTFGRWMQELDGRRVVVILDACHSAGQGANAKALDEWMPLDFASSELERVKDIGQEDAAIVASSTSEEVSRERLEGDLSVLTYYLVRALTNTDTPFTLTKLADIVTPQVKEYIASRYPRAKQSVFLQNDLTQPLTMNPRR